MTIKVVSQNHLFTISVILIIHSILTFFYQMLICLLNFDYLLTFPTCYKHWALFPIVDINWLTVETLIISTTKATCLFILSWKIILLIVLLYLFNLAFFLLSICITIGFFLNLWFGSWSNWNRSFSSLRIYVCRNINNRFRLNLIFTLILLLTSWLYISFCNCILNLLNLGWS